MSGSRFLHYSVRTEKAYLGWIRRFILFNDKRYPRSMGAPEVESFLSELATRGRVTASTQNQALSAIRLLCRQTLEIELIGRLGVNTATIYTHIPDCGGVACGVRRTGRSGSDSVFDILCPPMREVLVRTLPQSATLPAMSG